MCADTTAMDTIRRRRIDDEARRMMREGVGLTWEQVDEIGTEGVDWLRHRLHLVSEADETGMSFRPAPPAAGEDAR
jgi:hypothetical protein